MVSKGVELFDETRIVELRKLRNARLHLPAVSNFSSSYHTSLAQLTTKGGQNPLCKKIAYHSMEECNEHNIIVVSVL